MDFHPAHIATAIAISFALLPFIGMVACSQLKKSKEEIKH